MACPSASREVASYSEAGDALGWTGAVRSSPDSLTPRPRLAERVGRDGAEALEVSAAATAEPRTKAGQSRSRLAWRVMSAPRGRSWKRRLDAESARHGRSSATSIERKTQRPSDRCRSADPAPKEKAEAQWGLRLVVRSSCGGSGADDVAGRHRRAVLELSEEDTVAAGAGRRRIVVEQRRVVAAGPVEEDKVLVGGEGSGLGVAC